MNTTHSSGPWTARTGLAEVYVGEGEISGVSRVGLAKQEIPDHVVRIYQDEQGRRCTQFIAVCNGAGLPNRDNAHLIAAAPTMLEALKDAFEMLDEGMDNYHGEPLEVIARLREAIALAEGK